MLIIGFGHRARQGKNTAAAAMLDAAALDSQIRIYAFADALRAEVRLACAQMGGQLDLIQGFKAAGLMPGWVHCEDPKPRSLLQWWGTEYRRSKDPDYWVKRLKKTLDAHAPDVALITDVRFPNEVAAIREWGGVLVKVVRAGQPDIQVAEHSSEAALDQFAWWDYSLVAATLPELREKAREIFAQIARLDALR